MDKKEFQVLIKYCFLMGKNTVEAKTWLDAEFPDTVPGKSTIKDLYAKFGRGEMSAEDRERMFLINILRVILTIMHPNSPNPAPVGIRRAVRAALILTPLFGLQFILLPVQPENDHPLYYAYVYTAVVIIPYQGLCCAILFCFANHDVHQAIKRSFQRNISRQNTRWSNYHTAESAAGVFMVNGNGHNSSNAVPLLSIRRKSTTQTSVKSVRV
ncbi:hypothetical protein GWI33_018821 [Rhynchophorus ferrugineus]|uniref:Uncharacterized protein n=1 Tax=Rhynchophorus ferrugineus TaxID=354439 RepID=A0A834M5X7_RHYFE|nr:hypothetical protein GWI33_018821 [Rhynchophorus ferrugineus]